MSHTTNQTHPENSNQTFTTTRAIHSANTPPNYSAKEMTNHRQSNHGHRQQHPNLHHILPTIRCVSFCSYRTKLLTRGICDESRNWQNILPAPLGNLGYTRHLSHSSYQSKGFFHSNCISISRLFAQLNVFQHKSHFCTKIHIFGVRVVPLIGRHSS